jgi:hypothetical protein
MSEVTEPLQLAPSHPQRMLAYIPTWVYWILGLILLIIPAMWLPASGDMPSHLYNAWLTHQVKHGLAGFTLTTQFTNVATDILLYRLLPLGPHFAAASVNMLTVIVFFVGSVMFIRSVSERLPWPCLVMLAMFAYGVMYWLGFTNYMMGCGCGFMALGLGNSKFRYARWLALLMLILTFLMHLFVFAWTMGAAIVLMVIPRIPERFRLGGNLVVMAMSLAPLLFIHQTMYHLWGLEQAKSILGSDIIYVFGDGSYVVLVIINLIFLSLFLTNRDRLRQFMKSPLAWLYMMNAIFIFIVPHTVTWPAGNVIAADGLPPLSMLAFLTERLAFLQCVLLTALMANMSWEKWQKIAIVIVLCLHCFMGYQTAEKMVWAEQKLQETILSLPQGAKVIVDISLPGLRVPVAHHLIDTVCIDRCYDFADYEPSIGHFRIHAKPGNKVVMWRREDVVSVDSVQYSARPEDLPIYFISPCRKGLCVHSMQAGEPMFIGEIINHNQGITE